MTEKERMDYLVDRYGIVCKRTVAARILGVSPSTVSYMIRDGRLDGACAGSMVDMESIARYIAQPKQAEEEARLRRLRSKYGSEWTV